MRISKDEAQTILKIVHQYLGEGCTVRLFGSRVDDSQKGGDIDLYVEYNQPVQNLLPRKLDILTDIQFALGNQKVDLVIRQPGTPASAIHRQALDHGVLLEETTL